MVEYVYVLPFYAASPEYFFWFIALLCGFVIIISAFAIIMHRIKYGNWSGYVGPGRK